MSRAQESLLVIRSKLQGTLFEFMQGKQTGIVPAETVRLQITRMLSLCKEYHSALKEYLSTQIVLLDKCKARIKLYFQKSDISYEDLENALNGERSMLHENFPQMILEQTEEGRQAMAEIDGEHMKILELCNSIQALGDLVAEIVLRASDLTHL